MKTVISPMARIYGDLKIGTNCRIDDFVIITGDVTLGDNVHIGAFSILIGSGGPIVIEDYAGTSVRVSIFTASDDHASGDSLLGPCIPSEFKPTLNSGPITLRKHAHMGAHTVILPGVEVGMGTCVGAFTLINRNLPPMCLYAGIPAKFIKERGRAFLDLASEYELSKNMIALSGGR
jgi:acetyltransferase-like isoleucine patch superfamily enzyme